MRKKHIELYFLIISTCLSGCFNNNESRYLKGVADATGFANIADANVLFCYENITGWDSSGPLYLVADYSNVDSNIRFVNTTEKKWTLSIGRNSKFEEIVNAFIADYLKDKYVTFDDKYKIDWDKPYKYYSTDEDYIGCALIFYEDSGLLYALTIWM